MRAVLLLFSVLRIACQCSSLGAIGQQCNSSGLCSCKTNVEGAKCDTCKAGFFGLSSSPNGCQGRNKNKRCLFSSRHVEPTFIPLACGCHSGGSDPGGNGSCDVLTGQCVCKANVIGRQCDTCKVTFRFARPADASCRRSAAGLLRPRWKLAGRMPKRL